MTAVTTELPDYEGEKVSRVALKITGAGTGLSDSLAVQPIVMDLDDDAYFVIRVKANESASHYRDKNGLLVRLNRVHTESMAPIDRDSAEKVLAEYADVVMRKKAEAVNQTFIGEDDDEVDADDADDFVGDDD